MPIVETLSKFNWIDLVVLVLFLRMCFVGSKTGLIVELFKISGLILAVYISLHYFSQAGSFLNDLVPPLGAEVSDLICFIILAVLSYVTVAIIREAFMRMVKTEATHVVDRWGGLVLGFCRSFMFISMIFIIFYLSHIIYFVESVKKSYLGSSLVYADVRVYEGIFKGIVTKFAPEAQINKSLYDVLEGEKLQEAL